MNAAEWNEKNPIGTLVVVTVTTRRGFPILEFGRVSAVAREWAGPNIVGVNGSAYPLDDVLPLFDGSETVEARRRQLSLTLRNLTDQRREACAAEARAADDQRRAQRGIELLTCALAETYGDSPGDSP